MAEPLVVVFDTQLAIRLVSPRSKRYRFIRDTWVKGKFTLAVSPPVLEEYRDVLSRPRVQAALGAKPAAIEAFFHNLQERGRMLEGNVEMRAVEADPDDDKFLACAYESQAACLVSEDRHLRNLKYHLGVQLIGLDQFEKLLAGPRSQVGTQQIDGVKA